MVKHILGLHLRLLKAQFTRNWATALGLCVLGIYALGAGFSAMVGMIALRFTDLTVRVPVLTLAFAGLTLGWILLTIFWFGMDQTLSSTRFALFPLRAKDLLPGLTLATLVGVGGIFQVQLMIGFIAAWSTSVASLLAAIVAAVLGTLTCVWSSRAFATSLGHLMERRRTRDLAGVVMFVVVMGVAVGMQFVSRGAVELAGGGDVMGKLQGLSDVVSWTPLGWAWALPADVANGQWLTAGIHLVLAVILCAALWKAWGHYLDKGLTSPLEAGGDGEKFKANSWVDRVFPATPAGAIAARSLRYWKRDTRHLVNVLAVPLMPVIIVGPALMSGTFGQMSPMFTFVPVIMVWLLGMTVSSELTYDGSALSTHILTGVKGAEDRWGRLWAMLLVFAPMLLVVMVLSVLLTSRYDLIPGMVGATLGYLGASLGAGSWISAIYSQASPPPGGNPFSSSSKGSAEGFLSFLLVGLVSIGVGLPSVVFGLLSMMFPWAGWVALVLGLVTLIAATWGGVVLGGRRLDRKWPEVLKMVTYEG